MQKVLTAAEMREVDRITTAKYGIPPLLLMENAAHAAARVIADKLGGSVEDRSVIILCGKGNNGGDGAALARILWQQGADVEVCLFGLVEDTKDHARTNFEILQKITAAEGFELEQADLAFEEITGLEEWLEYDSANFHCDDPDVVVDALVGTGLARPLDGVYEQVAAYISAFHQDSDEATLVVSLDLPSGLDADRGECIGATVHADATVTFTSPKLGNVLPPAARLNGELYVANIGTSCEIVAACQSKTFVSNADDALGWLEKTKFSASSYKNKRGHALLIAGSDNYAGAAVLCGNAAIRTGAGLATVVTPKSSLSLVSSRVLPEVMVRGVEGTDGGAMSGEAFESIREFWTNVDAVAIGSGLSSTDERTRELVRLTVENRRTPLLLDADGLNSMASTEINGSDLLPIVLTPHNGEFMRLLGTEDKSALSDRVGVARSFAEQHHVILVLKGERAIVAAPDGRVVINPTGNSGLGKAGNGDTLAGIITGFIAQGVRFNLEVFEAVVAAVYFAGLAGDLAEEKHGKHIMTASDVRECLCDAFETVACGAS